MTQSDELRYLHWEDLAVEAGQYVPDSLNEYRDRMIEAWDACTHATNLYQARYGEIQWHV